MHLLRVVVLVKLVLQLIPDGAHIEGLSHHRAWTVLHAIQGRYSRELQRVEDSLPHGGAPRIDVKRERRIKTQLRTLSLGRKHRVGGRCLPRTARLIQYVSLLLNLHLQLSQVCRLLNTAPKCGEQDVVRDPPDLVMRVLIFEGLLLC